MTKRKKKFTEDLSPVAAPSASPTIVSIEQRIPLKTFVTLLGKKWDEHAGFVYHAQKKRLSPRSVAEWHDEMAAFQQKQVR